MKYFLYLASKQIPDETIRTRHRSATLRAHNMGLRIYLAWNLRFPPDKTYSFFPFSKWKAAYLIRTPVGLEPESAQCESETLPFDQVSLGYRETSDATNFKQI